MRQSALPRIWRNPKFRKILVAVDGSRQADGALSVATDMAEHYHATLCLLHAFPHTSDLFGTPQYEHLLAARSSMGETVLEAARRQVGEAAPVEMQLIEGPPARAILRVAQEQGCNMIVLGSRGHGQISGLPLGSVSNAVAQRAHCPVMIVH
jgi:nucleotide-binding universal stress UspA family protein